MKSVLMGLFLVLSLGCMGQGMFTGIDRQATIKDNLTAIQAVSPFTIEAPADSAGVWVLTFSSFVEAATYPDQLDGLSMWNPGVRFRVQGPDASDGRMRGVTFSSETTARGMIEQVYEDRRKNDNHE